MRKLSAIMFTDLVGYSALVQKDEPLAMSLLDQHRAIVRRNIRGFGGREVETAGDAFLIEFGSALDAAQCAIALQQLHAGHNRTTGADAPIMIRIGLHVGDIEHRPGGKVFGDGVNLAARIEPLAPPGGIAVSEQLHAQIRHRLGAPFRSLGPQALKNISDPVEVHVLDAAAVAALPPPTRHRHRLPTKPSLPWLAAGALVIAAAALLVFLGSRAPAARDRSVAVLPFANLSTERESQYFADGVHDAVINHLARVQAIKVISRTSVMEYRGKVRNLREIGRELGVAHVVEGSVQRSGDVVRVSAQLIAVEDDKNVWANSFDRPVADIFGIQSALAEQIVAAVRATLTPEERGRIAQQPTSNPLAYDLYLRADELVRQPGLNREVRFRTETLLREAITADPAFALAHAALSRNHMALYRYGIDTTAPRREQARLRAEEALRLQPQLAEAHLALGLYFFQGFRDYEPALKSFAEALRLSPNSADVLAFTGAVERRRGDFENSIARMRRSVELDPRNILTEFNIGETYLMTRRYAQAMPYYERTLARAREDVEMRLWVAYTQFLWKGDLEPLRRALQAVPAGTDPGQIVSTFRVLLARCAGRYEEEARLLADFPRDGLAWGVSNFEVPRDFLLGQALRAGGDDAGARRHFERARDRLRDYVEREPESAFTAEAIAWLGLAQANLGDVRAALDNANRAVTLLPMERDAVDAPMVAYIAATTRMRTGDIDGGLAAMEQLLDAQAGPHAHELRRDPEWKALWDDPRFRKLVDSRLPNLT